MKPIKLEVSAFGPYPNQVIIDFNDLQREGLFLITGPTGSGKTTIFDALTFALYGEASGSNRESKSLRCDFAPLKNETYVDLTFQMKKQIYQIKRSPQYNKPGRKTAVSAQAELIMPDGKIYNTLREVNKKIIEILGVDAVQFKQIAMIAQGEFTKLIHASSDEKEKIFRKLFGTKKYEDFEYLLKERYNDYKKKIDTSMIQIETLKKQLSYDVTLSTKEYLEYAKKDISLLKETLDKQNNQIKEENTNLLQLKQKRIQEEKNNQSLETLKKIQQEQIQLMQNQFTIQQKENTLVQIKKAQNLIQVEKQTEITKKQLIKLKTELENLEKQLKEEKNRNQILASEYKSVDEKQNDVQKLMISQENLKKELKDLKERKELLSKQEVIKASLDKLENEIAKIQLKQNQEEENLKQIELFLTDNNSNQVEIMRIHQEIKEETDKLQTLLNMAELQNTLDTKKKEFDLKTTLYKKTYQEIKKMTDLYLAKENEFLLSQAGILAAHLKDNEPCPVCGSCHHPAPAKIENETMTKSQLDKLKKELDQQQTNYHQEYSTLLASKREIDLLNNQLDEQFTAFHLKPKDYLEYVTKVKQTIDTLKKTLQQQLKINKQLSKEEKNKLSIQDKIHQLSTLKDEKQKQLQKINEEKILLDGRLENNSQNIKDELTVEKCLEKITKDIIDKQTKIREITQNYQASQMLLNQLQGQIKGYQHQIEHTNQLYHQQLENFEKELNKQFVSLEQYHFYKEKINDSEKWQKEIDDYYLAVEKNKLLEETLKKEITANEPYDLTVIDLQIKEKETMIETQQNRFQEDYATFQQTQSVIKQLEKLYLSIAKIEPEYQKYYELYNVVSGNNPMKLSFERYILAAYFEQILQLANLRFKDMTNQRYMMIRKEEKSSRQSGLDIVVQDFESGTIRDIKTLSGGETFKAALSLALGLSDMIQSYAGGIELNTLFIDEGFGSLDSDSLTQALNVLLHLRNHDKMIGIISHVQELKEQIDRQIVICKDRLGSHIEIK